MALTEIYIDPSLDADSGAGTVGDPAGDLEWYIEENDWPAAPTRVNIRSGTDEVLGADIETAMASVAAAGKTVAWVPTATAPLIIQGYTTAAGDGGVGGISGGGLVSIFGDGTVDFLSLIDLHMHNCGSNVIVNIDNNCLVTQCEINNSTSGAISADNDCAIVANYLHNVQYGVLALAGSYIAYNHIEDVTLIGLSITGADQTAHRNRIIVQAGVNGIDVGVSCRVTANDIYSAGGTGTGIIITGSFYIPTISNNAVEGFSGVGGIGFDLDASSQGVNYFDGNAAYNNETDYALTTALTDIAAAMGADNEVLTASPFVDAAGGDFTRVDTGNMSLARPLIIGGGRV